MSKTVSNYFFSYLFSIPGVFFIEISKTADFVAAILNLGDSLYFRKAIVIIASILPFKFRHN